MQIPVIIQRNLFFYISLEIIDMQGILMTSRNKKHHIFLAHIIHIFFIVLFCFTVQIQSCADPNQDLTQCTSCQGGQILLQSRCFAKLRGCLSYEVQKPEFTLICTQCQNGYLKYGTGCQRSAIVLNDTSNQIPPVAIGTINVLNSSNLGLPPQIPYVNRTKLINKRIKVDQFIKKTIDIKFPNLNKNNIFMVQNTVYQNINNFFVIHEIQYVNGFKVLVGEIIKKSLNQQQKSMINIFRGTNSAANVSTTILQKYFVISSYQDQKMSIQYQIINNSTELQIISARKSMNYDVSILNTQNITKLQTINTQNDGIFTILNKNQRKQCQKIFNNQSQIERILIQQQQSQQDKLQRYYKNTYDLFLLDPAREINITSKIKDIFGYLVNGTFVNLQFKIIYENLQNQQQYLVLGLDIRENKYNVKQYYKGITKNNSNLVSVNSGQVGSLNLTQNPLVINYAQRNQTQILAFLTILPEFKALIGSSKQGYKIIQIAFDKTNYIYTIKLLLSTGIHTIKLQDSPFTRTLSLIKNPDSTISTKISPALCTQISYANDKIFQQLDTSLRKSYLALQNYPDIYTQYKANQTLKSYRFLYMNNKTYQQVEFIVDQPIDTGKYKLRKSNILNEGYGYFGDDEKTSGCSLLSLIGKQFYEDGSLMNRLVENLSNKYRNMMDSLYNKYNSYVKDGVVQGIMSNGTHSRTYLSTAQYNYEYTQKNKDESNPEEIINGQLVIIQRKPGYFSQNLLPPGFNAEYQVTENSPDYKFVMQLQDSIIEKYKYYLANYLDWVYAQKQPVSATNNYDNVYQFLFKSAFGYYQIQVTSKTGATDPVVFGPLRRLTNWPDSRVISSQLSLACNPQTQIYDNLQNKCYDKIPKCLKQIGGICILCEPHSVLEIVFKKQCIIDCQKTMADQ